MAIELKVPEVGESITEVMIGVWKKQEGDVVAADESIVEIESDKATVELPAPASGTIIRVLKASGEKAVVGEVIGIMEPASVAAPAAAPISPQPTVGIKHSDGRTMIGSVQPPAAPVMPSSMTPSRVMPAAARVLGEAGVPAAGVAGTGPGGRVTKADAVAATAKPAPPAVKPSASAPPRVGGSREERYQLISPIRQRIAERLVEAQQQAALLTTFNECDMSAVMALRAKFKDQFQERYGAKLGFMSFFVRAAVEALRAV
ncbi:MAG: biotin/lipoyl-containing protein, partial [Pirellulales bacterium]